MTRLVRTELRKQRATRTVLLGIAAAPLIAALGTTALMAAAGKQGNAPLGSHSFAEALGAPAGIVTVITLLLGVLGMAGEYRHQTITTTFLVTPRRRDVVLAKLGAHALTGAAIGAAAVGVAAVIAGVWLHTSGVAVPLDTTTMGVIVGIVLSAGLFGALGVSIGALVRNQTAATALVLIWLLAVEGVIRDVVDRPRLTRWLPASAGRALVHTSPRGNGLPLPVAAAVFVGYVAALAAAGTRLTIRRDIT